MALDLQRLGAGTSRSSSYKLVALVLMLLNVGTDAGGGHLLAVSSTIHYNFNQMKLQPHSSYGQHLISTLNATITPASTGSSFIVLGHLSTGSNAGGPAGHGLTMILEVTSGACKFFNRCFHRKSWCQETDYATMVIGASE